MTTMTTETEHKPLTENQAKVLRFIREYYAEHGIGVSYRGIQNHMGWSSPNAAQSHVFLLVNAGLIKRQPRRANSIIPMEVQS
jgi:SOS-response transcriptional repressor LexA